MSDENTPAASESEQEETPAPKVRRISNKPTRKTTRKTAKKAAKRAKEAKIPVEEFSSNEAAQDPAPETKPEQSDSAPESKPQNRRRSRGGKSKPQPQTNDPESDTQGEESTPITVKEETISLAPDSNEKNDQQRESRRGRQNQDRNRPEQQRRPNIDPDKVAKNAWKIFLAEVSEEGVALIGDNDARELARRCFRLATIFLEEERRN